MSDDLIKRSDTIKAVRKSKWWHFCDLIPVLSAIKEIPSADRPRGEWIRTENHTIKCCECGAEFTDDIMDACLTSRVPFPSACPICMARMKGADDE